MIELYKIFKKIFVLDMRSFIPGFKKLALQLILALVLNQSKISEWLSVTFSATNC